MKTYQSKKAPFRNLVVIPFGDRDPGTAEELFDDCPLCQKLKKQIENGEVEEVCLDLDDVSDEE